MGPGGPGPAGRGPRPPAQEGPPDFSEQLEFADGLFARGLYDMALEEYRKVEQAAAPSQPLDAVLLRMGECHRHLGDKVAASAAYQRLIETYPDSPYRFRAEFRRAELYVAAARYPEALALLDELIARDPPEETEGIGCLLPRLLPGQAGAGRRGPRRLPGTRRNASGFALLRLRLPGRRRPAR